MDPVPGFENRKKNPLQNGLKARLIRHPDYVKGLQALVERPAIQVALTAHCNFNCVYCTTRFLHGKPVNMAMPLFGRILENCREWGIAPWFGQTYEPFLHPKIVEIISRVNAAGFRFTSSTNGSCLSSRVYDLPMNLVISISENEAEYRFRGSRVPFERYCRNLRAFVEHRIRYRIPGQLTFQFADYHMLETGDTTYDKCIRSGIALSEKMIRFRASLGIDGEDSIEKLLPCVERRESIPVFDDGLVTIRFVATRITPGITDNPEAYPEKQGYCDSCFHILSIQADGGIAYCCCDPQANTVFHRMTPDDHLKSIWTGGTIERIRQRFVEMNPVNPYCYSCLLPVSEHIKPLLTCFRKDIVAGILNEYGVTDDLPWFKF
jgi:MoaA/NifB/PqqE/SkfB family radical SAM enzyme